MNKTLLNKIFVTSIIFLLTLSSLSTSKVKAQEDLPNEVIQFLKEVIQLNTTKYYTYNEVGPNYQQVERFGETIELVDGKIMLQHEGVIVGALYNINNHSLENCKISIPQQWPPELIQWENVNNAAKIILNNYKTYLGNSQNNSDIDLMVNLLSKVESKNSTVIEGNIKLEVDKFGKFFKWSYHYNGADYPGIGISFQDNGAFSSFGDARRSYRIGSIEVNISEQHAIDFAVTQAKTYSFMCENGTVIELGFLEHFISAELSRKSRYIQKEYYPIWKVDIPLDNIYGQIFFIRVMFWADNGEIDQVKPLGYGIGFFDPEDILQGSLILTSSLTPSPTSTIQPTLTPTSTPEKTDVEFPVFIVASIIIIVVGSIGVLTYIVKIKRRA